MTNLAIAPKRTPRHDERIQFSSPRDTFLTWRLVALVVAVAVAVNVAYLLVGL